MRTVNGEWRTENGEWRTRARDERGEREIRTEKENENEGSVQ